MKVQLGGFSLSQLSRVAEGFIHTAILAQLKLDGHEYNERDKILTMPDVTVMDYITSPFKISEYAVWLEIPKNMTGPIPALVSFSGANEEIQVKWEDFGVLAEGTVNKIVYLQGATSNISKADCRAFINAGYQPLSMPEMQALLAWEEGEYFKPVLI